MSTPALRSSWKDNGEGSTSKNLGFTTVWPRENDSGNKKKKKKRHTEIYEKVLQRRTDTVWGGGGFKALMKMKMEVFQL